MAVKIFSRRGQGNTGIEKLLILVLVTTVIVLSVIIIFNFDIPGKLRNLLPSYSYNQDNKDVIAGSGEDKVAKSLCPVEIGNIKAENYLLFGTINYVYILNKKTNLFFRKSESSIKLYESFWSFNSNIIAKVNDKTILVNKEWFDEKNRGGHPGLPSIDDLKLLDGSFMLDNHLCREETSNN